MRSFAIVDVDACIAEWATSQPRGVSVLITEIFKCESGLHLGFVMFDKQIFPTCSGILQGTKKE